MVSHQHTLTMALSIQTGRCVGLDFLSSIISSSIGLYNTEKKVLVVAPCRQICHLFLISSLNIVANKSNNCGIICKKQALKQLRGGEKGLQRIAMSTILNTRTNADNGSFFLKSFWIQRCCKILISRKWYAMKSNIHALGYTHKSMLAHLFRICVSCYKGGVETSCDWGRIAGKEEWWYRGGGRRWEGQARMLPSTHGLYQSICLSPSRNVVNEGWL